MFKIIVLLQPLAWSNQAFVVGDLLDSICDVIQQDKSVQNLKNTHLGGKKKAQQKQNRKKFHKQTLLLLLLLVCGLAFPPLPNPPNLFCDVSCWARVCVCVCVCVCDL